MSASKQIVLVTGGSIGGMGFELAVQLLAQAKHVILGVRSADKRDAAGSELNTRGLPGTFEMLDLDISSAESISNAASIVSQKHSRLDALVNNAAFSTKKGPEAESRSLPEQFAMSFRTNATGTFLMVEAFKPLLDKAQGTARVINISSGAGSIRRILDKSSPRYQTHLSMGMDALAYGASKAAMNLITAKQATVYGAQGWKVFAFSPGFVVSKLSSMNTIEMGAQPTDAAVVPIVKILDGERDDEHGCFLGSEGQYEW